MLIKKEVKIRTAYGVRSPNSIPHYEKLEIWNKIGECFSIRGKNPIEFKNKLVKLIEEYE